MLNDAVSIKGFAAFRVQRDKSIWKVSWKFNGKAQIVISVQRSISKNPYIKSLSYCYLNCSI